jgi:trans-aconitate methyltransferase
VGQSGRAINVRYKEHIRYIKSNNSTSAYAAHILENRHEFGPKEKILQLLKPCNKGKHMDCWEALYMQVLRNKQLLIEEQQVTDSNPLFQMATVTYTP